VLAGRKTLGVKKRNNPVPAAGGRAVGPVEKRRRRKKEGGRRVRAGEKTVVGGPKMKRGRAQIATKSPQTCSGSTGTVSRRNFSSPDPSLFQKGGGMS